MLEWVHQHSQVLNVLLNAGMLAVWLFYAQLLLSSYRRQRRPQVLIAQTKGDDMNAEIMVTNMSEQSVFIEAVLAVVERDGETYSRPVTDATIDDHDESSGEPGRVTSQGPLPPGEHMQLGTFRRFTQWLTPGDDDIEGWDVLEIRLIFRYGSENHPIGIWRRFRLEDGDHGRQVRPETLMTQRLSNWRQRKVVKRWLEECL